MEDIVDGEGDLDIISSLTVSRPALLSSVARLCFPFNKLESDARLPN